MKISMFPSLSQVLAKFHKFLFRVYNDLQCKTSLKVKFQTKPFSETEIKLKRRNNSKVQKQLKCLLIYGCSLTARNSPTKVSQILFKRLEKANLQFYKC